MKKPSAATRTVRTVVALAALATLAVAPRVAEAANTYTADKAHTSVGFAVRRMRESPPG